MEVFRWMIIMQKMIVFVFTSLMSVASHCMCVVSPDAMNESLSLKVVKDDFQVFSWIFGEQWNVTVGVCGHGIVPLMAKKDSFGQKLLPK